MLTYVQSEILSCQKHELRVWAATGWLRTFPSPGWLCSPLAGCPGWWDSGSVCSERRKHRCILYYFPPPCCKQLAPNLPHVIPLPALSEGNIFHAEERKSCVYMPFPFWELYFSSASGTSTAAKTQYGAEIVHWPSPAPSSPAVGQRGVFV